MPRTMLYSLQQMMVYLNHLMHSIRNHVCPSSPDTLKIQSMWYRAFLMFQLNVNMLQYVMLHVLQNLAASFLLLAEGSEANNY